MAPPDIPNYTPLYHITSTRFSEVYKSATKLAYLDPSLAASSLSIRPFHTQDPKEDIAVAVKITTPDDEKPPHDSIREINILKALHSKRHQPNIVQLLDVFKIQPYDQALVLPWYETDLMGFMKWNSKCIKRKRDLLNPYLLMSDPQGEETKVEENNKALFKNEVPLEWCEAIFKGVSSALEFIHSEGIIHRDIKPSNIMFRSITDPTPVLIDFGISYDLNNPSLNRDEQDPNHKITDITTTIYKPPEAIFGLRNYGRGVDIWSLGIVLTKLYSENLKSCLDEDDFRGDFQLFAGIFEWFGRPTLKSWPESESSSTFMAFCCGGNDDEEKKDVEDTKFEIKFEKVIPRAPERIKIIFKHMMVYQSTERWSASKIVESLESDRD